MKLRKNWKRFWTLNRHHAEGFTLVELIVVIAILAILGGVAVPAYSGYVKKANMQADMTLISEIEHALMLAYYNQDLTEGDAGFLMLSPNEGESFDSNNNSLADYSLGGSVALAMERAFGSNWMEIMQLKHDNWGISWKTISYEDAKNVVASNYVQKYTTDELMTLVQTMTDAANGLQVDIMGNEYTLFDMFDYGDADDNAINDIISEYYGDDKEWDDFSATEKSNLLVLATATSISNGKDARATELIQNYALYTAYAADNAAFNEAYQTFQNSISNVNPDSADSQYEQIKSAYQTLQNAAGEGFNTWKQTNGANNQAAFDAIMTGVGNALAGNKDAILGDLDNANMFTSGIGNELYADYLDSAYASAGAIGDGGIGDAVNGTPEGWVTVYYTVMNGKIHVDNTMAQNG